MPARIVAAVLTGGSSSRMGSPKPEVVVSGRTMGEWIVTALAPLPTVAIGSPLGDLPLVEDVPGSGPLAGVAAALSLDADAVFVTAVDHPWLRPATVHHLTSVFDGRPAVPVDDDVRQVTCAVYPTALAPQARQGAAAGSAIQGLLDEIDVLDVAPATWELWGEDGRSWFSVDSFDDLHAGLERFGAPE